MFYSRIKMKCHVKLNCHVNYINGRTILKCTLIIIYKIELGFKITKIVKTFKKMPKILSINCINNWTVLISFCSAFKIVKSFPTHR